MRGVPSFEECIALLRETGCSESVINHSIAVEKLARMIAEKTSADLQLVTAGALLHDIGRSKTHDVSHGVEGAKIAKKLGLPSSLIKIIERHVGAGLTVEEAKKLNLPPKDYTPKTLEEKIVCHADSLIDNSKKQKIKEEIDKALKKGQMEHALRLKKLHEELSKIIKMDIDLLK